MYCLKDNSDKASALELMDRLAASGIRGTLRYHPDGRGHTTDEYAVYVEDAEVERACHVLAGDHADGDGREQDDEETPESMFICPRCSKRYVTLQEEPWLAVFFLSALLVGLPLLAFAYYVRTRGSKKRCDSCHHEWRSKP